MGRTVAVVALALLLAGCSSDSTLGASSPSPSAGAPEPTASIAVTVSAAPAASPTPTSIVAAPPPGTAEAVIVDPASSPARYSIALVGTGGGVFGRISAANRTPITTADGRAVELPYVSTTRTALYYLDGDSRVFRATPGAQPTLVATLPVSPGTEATFAVSPDDGRIAYGLLDFNRKPVHVQLGLGSFNGDAGFHTTFESDSDYVWPVAWHGGLLVLARGAGPCAGSIANDSPGLSNPYSAISYHLVDPATAERRVLMGQCTVSGPLSPAGTACIQGASLGWQGGAPELWGAGNWGSVSSAAALSPDGSLVAAAVPGQPTRLGIYHPTGNLATWVDGPPDRYWVGWLDATHLWLPNSGGGSRIIELKSGPSPAAFVDVSGSFAAVLPTDLV